MLSHFCALIQSSPSQPCPFRPPILTPVTDAQAYTQAKEIMEALQFREKVTNELKRDLSLTTLMTQTAGEMAHCAWMASCASGTLPKSVSLATSDPCVPIPGLAKEPPALDPRDDPFGHAYDE
eukprot:4052371-Pyramimonas_sp.AAC.1